jgi:hypothetical protein
MLVACRLAGLSALEAHYAGLVALRQTKGGGPCLLRPGTRPPAPARCRGCSRPAETCTFPASDGSPAAHRSPLAALRPSGELRPAEGRPWGSYAARSAV